jgi:hypothetical protein
MLLTNFVIPQLPKPAVVVDESAQDISSRVEDSRILVRLISKLTSQIIQTDSLARNGSQHLLWMVGKEAETGDSFGNT